MASIHGIVANRLSVWLGKAILCLVFAGCSTGHVDAVSTQSAAALAAAAQAESPPGNVGKQPNYRQVVIAAQSQNDHPLSKLTAEDLRLYQGDKQLQIAFFSPQPATVGIVVDTSGSMDPKLPLCRIALKAFIEDLNPSDEISLFAFSDRQFLLAKWTTDHAAVIQRLAILHAYGRTALYDSLTNVLTYLSKSNTKRKAILLTTDGIDDASHTNLEHVEDLARKMNVPIYSIGIGNPNAHPPSFSAPRAGITEAFDTKQLTSLAKETGGEAFVVTLDDKGAALKHTTAAIAGRIGSQYEVGFIGDGSTSQLRVEAPDHKDLIFKIESAAS